MWKFSDKWGKNVQNSKTRKNICNYIIIAIIIILMVCAAVLDFIKITYSRNPLHNRLIARIIQQSCGALAGTLILRRLNIRLFKKPQNCLYLIPCIIIAVDNFQFSAFFSGKMQLLYNKPIDFLLFFGYCMFIGLFEEIVFRGIIFSIIAGLFIKDRKGFLQTYVVSSLVFGLAHLFNGFSAGTLLQVGYTILTGGLFAFCLIKTKNILCCALVHGLYNFCGLLFDAQQGLGNGVVFDVGTVITMATVSVAIGIFVLYHVWKYSDAERKELYFRLGIKEEGVDENA